MSEQTCGTCRHGKPCGWKHGQWTARIDWVICTKADYPDTICSMSSKLRECAFNPSRWEPREPDAA